MSHSTAKYSKNEYLLRHGSVKAATNEYPPKWGHKW